jgi:hypothetical protein
MVLLWYSGARSSELVEIKRGDVYALDSVPGLAITLRTLKGGEDYRKISIPRNDLTLKMLDYIDNSAPVGYYFHAFRKDGKHVGRWFNKKILQSRKIILCITKKLENLW